MARHFKTDNPLARTDFIENHGKARSYKDPEGTIAASSSSVQQAPVFRRRFRLLNSNEETKKTSPHIRNVFRRFKYHLIMWRHGWSRTRIPAMRLALV